MVILNDIMYLIALIAMVWVISDVWIVNKRLSTGVKILWTIGAIVFSFIVGIIYLFVEKK